MMKAGGEAKRRELIQMFGGLSLTDENLAGERGKMNDEEQKISKHGEDGQA